MAERNSEALIVTTPTERELVMTRVFSAPRSLVFAAYTEPEHLPHWMLGPPGWTMPVCEIDFRPEGAWRFGWLSADGSRMEMSGVYREILPPERVIYTERWGGKWPETVNTLTLVESDGKTTVSMQLLYPSKEARDAALATGMKDGASISLDRLADYLGALRGEGK